MDMLRFALMRGNKETLVKDQNFGQDILIKIGEKKEVRLRFEREEIVPTLASLEVSQPQLALVFNCNRDVLKMPGFPCLLREKAEFFEVGELRNFTVTKFVKTVRTFGNINQRWGL